MKKQLAFNKLFNLFILLGLLCLGVTVTALQEKSLGEAIGFGTLTLLLWVLPGIFTPCCYLFDSEGVSLCYVLVPNERYLWKNIHAITVEYDSSYNSDSFDLFFAWVFSLKGNVEGECRFYMNGHIRKSFRTKRLLETYWDGTITGYVLDDAKEWIAKRRRKKQKAVQAHLTDEITPMEREMRAQVRQWMAPFADRAKQQDLALHTEFVYVPEDGREQKSRPKEGYTYACIVKIAPTTDPQRFVDVSADLLYVRLGRTAYRGVANRTAREELTGYLEDCLTEIAQNGLEAYGI